MTKRFKIEPDFSCPELAGYKLPEVEQRQEDDVVAMAKEEFNSIDKPIRSGIDCHSYKVGFAECYTKAREKFEFTESDLRQAVALSLDDAEKSVIWSKEWYPNKLADKIIASLRTQRTPIAIEVEMVESPSYNAIRMQDKNDCFAYFIPATNPDGTVKGVYVYE